jgi:hypothetical protein
MENSGEGKHLDLKISFDQESEKAKVDLVKNLVALANAGGGSIVYGRDETATPGIGDDTRQALDSARLMDLVTKYIRPSQIGISHSVEVVGDGRYLLTISVDAAEYPMVMSRKGDWKGSDSKKDRPLFVVGDIWTRHGSKTERISFEDLREWIEQKLSAERNSILSRIATLVNLPEGAEIQVVSGDQKPSDGPNRFLEFAALQHDYDQSYLLSSGALLTLFTNRFELDYLTAERLRFLLASALRRKPTLYWWLVMADMPQCRGSG